MDITIMPLSLVTSSDHLTKKGEGVICILDTKIRNAVDSGGNGLTGEQRQTFYAALDIISANLEKFTKEKNNENN